MKKGLLLSFLVCASMGVYAQMVGKSGDLYYKFNSADKTAAVANAYYDGNDMNCYKGDIVVPPTVTYNGVEYSVTSVGQFAFNDYDEVTSVTLPSTILTLDEYSFDSTLLTDLVIPNSVKTIGVSAFQYSKLKRITFGSGVVSVGNNAFKECTSLTEVECLGKTPFEIQSGTFPATVKKNVTLKVPAGSVEVYRNAANWAGFKAYEEVETGTVSVDGICVIDGICYKLTTRPYDTDRMEAGVNEPNSGMEYSGEITIPSEFTCDGKQYVVTGVNYGAFCYQSKVTAIILPETLNTISNHAFSETSVSKLILPEKVKSIGMYAFRNCAGLKELVSLNPKAPAVESTTFAGLDVTECALFVPRGCVEAYKKNTVWSKFNTIQEYADSPVRPESVTLSSSEIKAFKGSVYKLTAVVLPDDSTDKTVEWKSLNTDVATVDDDGTVTLVGAGVGNIEAICNGNTTVSAMCRVISIEPNPTVDGLKYQLFFEKDTGTERKTATLIRGDAEYKGDIVIPETITPGGITYTVKGIGANAFALYKNVKSVTIPASVDTIGYDAFRQCEGLERINISSLDDWCDIQFKNRNSNPIAITGSLYLNGQPVTEVNISERVKEIRPFVFQGLSALRKLTIASGVKIIGQQAFSGTSIESVTVPASVDSLGISVFKDCSLLREVSMPEGIGRIPQGMFQGTGLRVFDVPQSVKTIDAQAFMSCPDLISVALPDHLEQIGMMAFYDSPKIRYIRCVNMTPPVFFTYSGDPTDYGQAFSPEIWPACELVIPASMFGNYKKCAGWKNFRSWVYWHDGDEMPVEVKLTPDSYIGKPGDKFTLTPSLLPADADFKTVIVTNSNPEVATIGEDNVVTLLTDGTTTFTAYCGLISSECTVTVDSRYDSVEEIGADMDGDAEVEIYTFDGVKVFAGLRSGCKSLRPGLYILKSGSRTEKIIIR